MKQDNCQILDLLHLVDCQCGALDMSISISGYLEFDLLPFLDNCHGRHDVVCVIVVRNPLVVNGHLNFFRMESIESCLFCLEVAVSDVKVNRGVGFKLNVSQVIEVHISVVPSEQFPSVIGSSSTYSVVDKCELFHLGKDVEPDLLPPQLLLLVAGAGQLAVVHAHFVLRGVLDILNVEVVMQPFGRGLKANWQDL